MDDQNLKPGPGPEPDRDPFPKHCSRCGETFPQDITVCPDDGTPLIMRDPGQASPAVPGPPGKVPRSATLVVGSEATGDVPEPGEEAPVPSRSQDPLVGQLLRNKWKVLERIGAGSFGTVYKVQDVKGGWIEALKILSVDRLVGMDAEHARKRFLREAQLVKRLGKDSSHIVGLSTYEEDLEAGLIYFLMDYVEGDSLGDAFRSQGPFAPERAVHLALQVCDALMVAHEGPEPVVHRDLKPENIMLTKGRGGEEVVKVLDFGIAKIAEREQDSRLTEAGTSLGTPGFAAPEQLRAGAVDARTDLFAFGVILYTMLTGRDPWLGYRAGESTGKIYELMVASERGEVKPLEETGVDVPEALGAIVLKLLQREPEDRFASARELAGALQTLSLGPAPSPRKLERTGVGKGTRSSPWSRPTVLLPGIVGVAVVLGLLVVRPWGRTLDLATLQAEAGAGTVRSVRVVQAGLEGNLSVLGFLPGPFRVAVGEVDLPGVLGALRGAGVAVDATWALDRLVAEAVRAQAEMRYFGNDGNDVRGVAERMMALDPDNPEARSLLLKVAEHMAWDAEAAFEAGSSGAAQDLLRECRAIVPNHPRCEAAAPRG